MRTLILSTSDLGYSELDIAITVRKTQLQDLGVKYQHSPAIQAMVLDSLQALDDIQAQLLQDDRHV